MNGITKLKPSVWGLIGSLGCLAFGICTSNLFASLLAVALIFLSGRKCLQSLRNSRTEETAETTPAEEPKAKPAARKKKRKKVRKRKSAKSPADYIRTMVSHGRYALLLRDEVIGNLDEKAITTAREELSSLMSPVTAGEVNLRPLGVHEVASDAAVNTSAVEEFFIDRFAVTNEEFKRFVDDDGYANDEYWPEEVRAARCEFVDQSGKAGPRFWQDGSFTRGEGQHPVVGVSWYEAQAYARWQGKRLPTNAEWTKAASSPSTGSCLPGHERKYPWGSTLEDGRANLWSTGIGSTVPVGDFDDGNSSNGVCQLIGNVWEWTSDNFPGPQDGTNWEMEGVDFKSLRGGAFDTYFEHRATCDSKSADDATARKHNVGFRCVLSANDVASCA